MHFLPKIVAPGTTLGTFQKSLADRTGLAGVKVVTPSSHDTASAVAGVPTANTGKANWAYISSGTWSLMGVEVQQAVLTPRALEVNMTRELGSLAEMREINRKSSAASRFEPSLCE